MKTLMNIYSSVFLSVLFLILSSCSEKVKITPDQADSFVKYIGGNNSDIGNDVKEIPGVGYAVAGTTTQIQESQQPTKDILFFITDRKGNLLHPVKTIDKGYDDFGNSLALIPGGDFILAGTTTLSDGSMTNLLLVRLNSSGEEVWQKTYGGAGLNTSGNIVKVYGDTIFVGGTFGNNAWVLKTNFEGDTLWTSKSRLHPVNNTSVCYDIGFLNNNYLLTGVDENTSLSGLSFGFCSLWDTKITSGTNPFEGKSYSNSVFVRSCIVDNSEVLTCGSFTGSDNNSKGLLVKLGGDFSNPVWSKVLGESSRKVSGKSVRMLPDGRIAVLATSTLNDNSDIVIYILNSAGNLENTVSFGDNSVQEATAFEVTSDGGFIITGSNTFDKNSMVCLIKLNSKGELQ